MSNERVILCGGLRASGKARGKDTVPLSLWGKDSNVMLKVGDISQKMNGYIKRVDKTTAPATGEFKQFYIRH